MSQSRQTPSLIIQNRAGLPISTMEEWFQHAPPRLGKRHWKDLRSAKEQARAWLRNGSPEVPEELTRLFETHDDTKGFTIDLAIPELVTPLDNFGEGRNHDLIGCGKIGGESAVIGIEAKADESFGDLISSKLGEGDAKQGSQLRNRIHALLETAFGSADPRCHGLRYQLLHAFVGTLIEAKKRRAKTALFVVHEFISKNLSSSNLDRNARDLNSFVRALHRGNEGPFDARRLIGPLTIAEYPPVYLGKATVAVVVTHSQLSSEAE